MKNIKKLILALLAIVLAVAMIPATKVLAEETEKNFTTLDEDQEFLVCIEWENTRPVVKFISPSGEVYDTAVEREDTKISVGNKMLYYYIENAEKGRWKIVYDKLDNENIYVTLEEATAPFVVTEVNVEELENSTFDVSFFVEYNIDRAINYKIYVSANETSRGKEIRSGAWKTNETAHVTVSLDTVSSYSNYRVYVYAYFNKDGVDIFDGAYSDTFAYTNPNQTDMTSPSNLVIMPNEYTARLYWEPKSSYTYIVSIFEDGSDEPTIFEEITDTSVKNYDFSYGVDAKKIEIRIAEKYRTNAYSNEKIYTVDLTALPGVEFEETLSTNKGYVSFHYSNFLSDNKVEVELNGEKKEVILYVEKDGDLEVEVNEDYNTVAVIYYVDDEITARYEKEIYFNNEPPRIYMLNDYTDVTTDKATIDLIGSAQGADRVVIADNEVEVAADGSFSYTAKLKEGENIISIEAYDILGNGSMYTAKVTYKPSQAVDEDETEVITDENGDEVEEKEPSKFMQMVKNYLPGIITLVIGLALIIVVAVIPKKEKKSGALTTIKKVIIYLLAVGAAVDGYFLYNFIKLKKEISSLGFIETAYDSIEAADKLLVAESKWKNYVIYATIEVVACAVILGILILVSVLVKKHKAKKNAGAENKSAE